MILWLWQLEILEYSNNLRWSCIARTQTITTTNNQWITLVIVESRLNIEVQWFALSSWFLSTVKYSNALNCSRNSLLDSLNREWTVEVNCYHTNFLTLLYEVIDSFASWLCCRTHQYDNVFCIFCTIIVKQMVFTTCNLADFSQVLLYNLWDCIVIAVRSLTVCEECFWILSCTTSNRTFRSKCTVAEILNPLLLNQWTDVFHIHFLNLMILMRSTEAVEEVNEWNFALEGS